MIKIAFSFFLAAQFALGSAYGQESKNVKRGIIPASSFPSTLQFGLARNIEYKWLQVTKTIDAFFLEKDLTAMIAYSDGKVVYERYAPGVMPQQALQLNSCTKSYVSVLVGIALDKGLIKNLDDSVENYVPELAGTLHGQITIKNHLRMTSGYAKTGGLDWGHKEEFQKLAASITGDGLINYLRTANEKSREQGSYFAYSNNSSATLGVLLTKVFQKSLSAAAAEYLFHPLGSGLPAHWRQDKFGIEFGAAGLFVSAQDFLRFGIMLVNDGTYNGKSIVSAKYVQAATGAGQDNIAITAGVLKGQQYAYHFWVPSLSPRIFMAKGLGYQRLLGDPRRKTVVVFFRDMKKRRELKQSDIDPEAIRIVETLGAA